jgi:SAM-dependent methyltransferase
MDKGNVYDDSKRAQSYARLEFPGTYYLAFRDIPEIIGRFVTGNKALDFGCGTGRSTRFLNSLGFETIGIDISESMLTKAREFDPKGDYRIVQDGDLGSIMHEKYNLILSAFAFDNIPEMEKKVRLFSQLADLLANNGRIINLVSAPEIYVNEWASFTTKDFPENRNAQSGDRVKIIMTDVDDKRPVEDILWSDEAYKETYLKAGLELIASFNPLAEEHEPYEWVSETEIAPWTTYVLGKPA